MHTFESLDSATPFMQQQKNDKTNKRGKKIALQAK